MRRHRGVIALLTRAVLLGPRILGQLPPAGISLRLIGRNHLEPPDLDAGILETPKHLRQSLLDLLPRVHPADLQHTGHALALLPESHEDAPELRRVQPDENLSVTPRDGSMYRVQDLCANILGRTSTRRIVGNGGVSLDRDALRERNRLTG